MEYRTLGRSGCAVSTLALGTMTFGSETDEDGSHAQLDTFVEAGRHPDRHRRRLHPRARRRRSSAAGSPSGRPMSASQVVLATKGRFPMGEGPNDVGLSRRHLRARAGCLAAAARRRVASTSTRCTPGTRSPRSTRRSASSTTPCAPARSRYVGLSNFTGWQLQKTVELAERRGLAAPVTLQPQYNLLVREIEWEIVPACARRGLGLLPWSPLGGGWLTGKYRGRSARPAPPGSARTRSAASRPTTAAAPYQRTWDVIDAVQSVADARGV